MRGGEDMNKTLVLFKPTTVFRGLCGAVIQRYEDAGLRIRSMVLKQFPREAFQSLYFEHNEQPFYEDVVIWMSSHPIVALVLEFEGDVVGKVRKLNGALDPLQAAPGTIRGDFGISLKPDNLVHASDCAESVSREIALFFPEL